MKSDAEVDTRLELNMCFALQNGVYAFDGLFGYSRDRSDITKYVKEGDNFYVVVAKTVWR